LARSLVRVNIRTIDHDHLIAAWAACFGRRAARCAIAPDYGEHGFAGGASAIGGHGSRRQFLGDFQGE
jgi:hypothetical protein